MALKESSSRFKSLSPYLINQKVYALNKNVLRIPFGYFLYYFFQQNSFTDENIKILERAVVP